MKIYQVSFNNKEFLISDELKVINNLNSSDIASVWSKNGEEKWKCDNRSIPYDVSQLSLNSHGYIPTKIIFFLTSNCNLNCKYCYSKLSPINYTLNLNKCKAVIDKMVENLKKQKKRTLKIKFHGGGEPFVAFGLMKKIVEYARLKSKKEILKLKIDVSTNGLLTNNQRTWIVQNVDRLSISFDGTKSLQRRNRPAKASKIDSYLELKKTVEFFDSISYPLTLRISITHTKLGNVSKIISESRKLSKNAIKKLELVCENKSDKSIQLQFSKSINYPKFLNEYFQAKSQHEKDILSFDACDAGYGQCGAWGDNLILDGLNNISTCFKYSALGRNSPFYVCSLDDFLNEQITLKDENKIIKIIKHAENTCAYCFLWKKCGGGCIALRDENNSNLICNLLRTFFITKLVNGKQD